MWYATDRKSNLWMVTALLLMTAPAGAESVKTLEATSESIVVISSRSGDIQVAGWDRNQVKVTSDGGEPVMNSM